MSITVNGTTFYRFPASVFVTVSGGAVLPLANTSVVLRADETTTATLAVVNGNGQAYTPVTDSNGLLPEFYAPQYDDVIADAGAGRQAIRCSEIAEVIGQITSAATAAAVAALDSRLDALEADAVTTAERAKLAALTVTGASDGAVLRASGGVFAPALLGDFAAEEHTHPDEVIFIAQGGAVPPGTPTDTLVAESETVTSTFGYGTRVGSVGSAAGNVTATTGVSFTLSSPVAVGELLAVCIAASAVGGVAATWTVTGGGNTYTTAQSQIQGTVSQTAIVLSRVTTAMASGATITIKPNADVDEVCAVGVTIYGAATSPVDQALTAGNNSLNPSVGPTATTTVANEVALAAFCWSPGSPVTREFTPVGQGVVQAGTTVTSGDTTPRALAVLYKTLTATGQVTLGGTLSGTAASWSGSLVTIKKAA